MGDILGVLKSLNAEWMLFQRPDLPNILYWDLCGSVEVRYTDLQVPVILADYVKIPPKYTKLMHFFFLGTENKILGKDCEISHTLQNKPWDV